jgi:uncharacterized protein YbjT (DUF2867 family)
MRLLVTGGSGFLGRRVVPLAVEQGHEVVAVARSSAAARVVRRGGAQPIFADLNEPATVDDAFAGVGAEALINLASLGFGHAPAIVAAAEEFGPKRAVFVSTTAIFTNLNAPSKQIRIAAEQLVSTCGLDWTIIRPTMIYGTPDDRNLSRLLRVLRRTLVLPLPDGGRRLQQPVHVDDLAQAVLAALATPVAVGKSYDIAGPEPLTFQQLLSQSAAAVGRRPLLVPVPLSPMIAALRLYERMARRPRIAAEQLERLAEDKAFSISEAVADFGYRPRPFPDGIRHEAAAL